MNLFDGLTYLYYVFFGAVLLLLIVELAYKIISESTKVKLKKYIFLLRKSAAIVILVNLYITTTLLYSNGYGFIGNSLYYTSIPRDVFIGIALSMPYIPILYLFVRTAEYHSSTSNIFTRNKYRYVFDISIAAGVLTIFILNSSAI